MDSSPCDLFEDAAFFRTCSDRCILNWLPARPSLSLNSRMSRMCMLPLAVAKCGAATAGRARSRRPVVAADLCLCLCRSVFFLFPPLFLSFFPDTDFFRNGDANALASGNALIMFCPRQSSTLGVVDLLLAEADAPPNLALAANKAAAGAEPVASISGAPKNSVDEATPVVTSSPRPPPRARDPRVAWRSDRTDRRRQRPEPGSDVRGPAPATPAAVRPARP